MDIHSFFNVTNVSESKEICINNKTMRLVLRKTPGALRCGTITNLYIAQIEVRELH